MEIQVQEILKTKARLIQIYVQHNTAGKNYNDLYGDMERDNFMNPEESLQYGLIDKIIDKRPE
jgi:ATP-dependent Clp protease protease subunit